MSPKLNKDRRMFEWMLIAVVFGIITVAFQLGGYKLIALHLFYLPIILSGYFLGRTSATLLAVLCALGVTIVTALDPIGLAIHFTPLMGALALAVWAAILALSAILVGTLCDERSKTVDELHQAYVGVVEVLSKYVQGGHPKTKARSIRVAELSQVVGAELKLSRKQIDDIRVGALLHDLGNVEITTKLITKAVDTLETSQSATVKHTFAGMDLVHSLGNVLQGAVPLLAFLDQDARAGLAFDDELGDGAVPIGARIIKTVRAYDALAGGEPKTTPQQAMRELRNDPSGEHDVDVLRALERVVERGVDHVAPEPAFF